MAIGVKTVGRTARMENTATKDIRAILKKVMNDKLFTIESFLNELLPKERIELVIKLMGLFQLQTKYA